MSSETEESNNEKITSYFRLKQEYFEERKKIINKLYKKTKFIESTNEKKRLAIKEDILESDIIKSILLKMQKIKKSRGFKMGNTHNLQNLLESQFKKVEEMKEHIINLKLDLLFNYKSEDDALAEITVKIPEFNRQLEIYKKYVSDYENVVNNHERRVQLMRIRDDIQTILMNIEKQQEVMNQAPDPLKKLEIIHNILETYQTSLQFNPDYQEEEDEEEEKEEEGRTEELRRKKETETTKQMKLKYADCSLYKVSQDDDEIYLIQIPYTISQLEVVIKK
uniref:Uncharacterized protein n=1 Tax=viral metagenome TaxID=1070528 RepID=A0A6C0I107_9ZZZZ